MGGLCEEGSVASRAEGGLIFFFLDSWRGEREQNIEERRRKRAWGRKTEREIEQRKKLEQRKKPEQRVRNGGFISLHLLGGKFCTVKYLLPSTFLLFATVEACWMLWYGHQRPILPVVDFRYGYQVIHLSLFADLWFVWAGL